MYITAPHKVSIHEIDINGNLYPSVLLTLMQEAAHGQFDEAGNNIKIMRTEKNLGLWVTRIAISVYDKIGEDDVVYARSSPTNDSRGLMFNRCYQLVRGDEVVAEAISVWTLLDTKEMRPIRFSDTDFGMPFEDPIEISAPARFPFPRDMELVEAGRHKVRYSDIDYNQHLTNTRYPNLICDMLPSLEGKRVSEFSISFVNQAETGEDLTFLVGEADGAYYVRSLRIDGKVNVEARVKLENL
ncbi:MAG: hypothetical protein II297_06140 [Clostridia bacterium]|nr:hypothetical protein [Clostridia bacterium]